MERFNVKSALSLKLMHSLVISTFLSVCESRTLTAELEKRINIKNVFFFFFGGGGGGGG